MSRKNFRGDLERASLMPDFNLHHPEMDAKTEVFLGNFSQEGFDKLNFKKKRIGSQAYDHFGKDLEDPALRPVFIDKEEYAPTQKTRNQIGQILDSDKSYQEDQRKLIEDERKELLEQNT